MAVKGALQQRRELMERRFGAPRPMLYVATREPLPLKDWHLGAAACVYALKADEAEVGRHFSLPHVCYVGSYSQCGSGFLKFEQEDRAERARTQASYDAVAALLESAGEAELLFVMQGAWRKKPTAARRVSLADFRHPDFTLALGELVRVAGYGE